jgi:hypothetical protein
VAKPRGGRERVDRLATIGPMRTGVICVPQVLWIQLERWSMAVGHPPVGSSVVRLEYHSRSRAGIQ